MRPYWHLPFLLFCILIVGNGCSRSKSRSLTEGAGQERASSDAASTICFRDVTEHSGVTAVYRNGEEAEEKSIVESLGGGVGLFDYDRDGQLDLLFPGGGTLQRNEPLQGLPTSLWRGIGDLQFKESSGPANVRDPRHYTHGCAAADIDSDGFLDFVLTGYGGLQLFHNQGDGTFVERTVAAGLSDSAWSSSAAWGDFNRDGNLDLYVAHYVDWSWKNHPRCPAPAHDALDVCTPNDFSPLPDVVYLSEGDGTFRAVSKEIGLAADGKGLGVIVADLNLDSHVDVYVANDTTNNFLYVNKGDGTFRDTGLISGTALDGNGTPNGSMGLAVVDYDRDLLPDLWVTNYESETFALYRNNEEGNFLWATERAGVNALGTLFVGFGTVAGDFDLDGDEDLAVANGHVQQYPRNSTIAQKALFLLNSAKGPGTGRLVRQNFGSSNYFSADHTGRGLAYGDLDGDGDLDLVFSNVNEPAAILANETETSGESLTVQLIGTRSNRDAIGARVVMKTDAGSYARSVVGGGSYLSQSPYTLTWAIPQGEEFIELDVTWPNGSTQSLSSLSTAHPNLVIER